MAQLPAVELSRPVPVIPPTADMPRGSATGGRRGKEKSPKAGRPTSLPSIDEEGGDGTPEVEAPMEEQGAGEWRFLHLWGTPGYRGSMPAAKPEVEDKPMAGREGGRVTFGRLTDGESELARRVRALDVWSEGICPECPY